MTQIYTRSDDAPVSSLVAPPPHKREQVVRHIRTLIASMDPGDRLPSVSALEQQLGVARKTVVAALETLQKEGVIDARPRSGTFVAERGQVLGPTVGLVPPVPQRQLAHSNTIALFAYRPSAYYLSWINHLVVQAGAMGLDVQCQYTFRPLTEEHIAHSLASAPLGALVFSTAHQELVQQIQTAGRPVVIIGEPRLDFPAQAPYVCSDARQGGYLAARHLLDLGHRRIAYVHWMSSDQELMTRWRWRGHEEALREAGLSEPPQIISADRFAAWREYPEVLRHDLTRDASPTAFAAWSDIEAAELVTALCRADLRVPDDASVIGYDNLPESIRSTPRLTTVDQDMKTLAHRALTLLLDPAAYADARAAVIAATRAETFSPTSVPYLLHRESTAPQNTKR